MTDRRRRAAASDDASREDNPFAPPPEGQPDQPWEPRRTSDHGDSGTDSDGGQGAGSGSGSSGSGSGSGSDAGSGSGAGQDGEGKPSRWGSKWSSRQPGRGSGGFGGRPGNNGGPNGNGGSGGSGGNGGNGGPGGQRGMRWDPTDPLQRHARYALHAGIWGLFFVLLSIPQVALLLGALSLYWGISALRGKPPKSAAPSGAPSGPAGRLFKGRGSRATAEDVAGTDRTHEDSTEADEPDRDNKPQVPLAVTPEQATKAKKTAAISGLVTAGLTLVLVVATFTFQSVYEDYYTCKDDALTQSSRAECKDHLPEKLRPFLEDRD